ncbi:fimbria/pilus outer membrane usher protein, partial [uncultured Nitratireductor sp.]|uniref:fimbria/pilus outer membrane usher protein n=1 Tax=uncultured Nitratireductor sp. TaxID=520953 RepID=UPI0025E8FD90
MEIGPGRELYLEVFINDASTNLIGAFVHRSDGELVSSEDELIELGIKPRSVARDRDGMFSLDRLPDLSYRIDEAAQRLYVSTTNAGRAAKVVDLSATRDRERLQPQSSIGAVLNYSLFASSNALFEGTNELFQGVSGSFDARLFSRLGALRQSFIADYSDGDLNGFTRLNTTWSYSNPEHMLTFTAGDFVSGGLSWTRPVYLGGLQVRRNFSLRSDLVSLPLPSFSGTAAVPSTLEVYTQNARSYAGEVSSGPFQVVNLPVFTGAGEARVVLRDRLGRETVTTLPFYTSSMLLRQGLFDFSIEAGFPRRNFGIDSDDYDARLYGIASARYGLTNWLTLEGHIEVGEDLVNGGAGVAFPLGAYGAASIAVAGSHHDGQTGGLINASLELSHNDWNVYGRIQRAF